MTKDLLEFLEEGDKAIKARSQKVDNSKKIVINPDYSSYSLKTHSDSDVNQPTRNVAVDYSMADDN